MVCLRFKTPWILSIAAAFMSTVLAADVTGETCASGRAYIFYKTGQPQKAVCGPISGGIPTPSGFDRVYGTCFGASWSSRADDLGMCGWSVSPLCPAGFLYANGTCTSSSCLENKSCTSSCGQAGGVIEGGNCMAFPAIPPDIYED